MKHILEKICQLDASELQEVMQEIEQCFASKYPEWDVLYIAVRKDPVLRQYDLQGIARLLKASQEKQAGASAEI